MQAFYAKKQKKKPPERAALFFNRLLYYKGRKFGYKVVALVAVYLEYDGFGKVETEDAEQRFRVYYETAATQIYIVRVLAHNVYKVFDAFRHT